MSGRFEKIIATAVLAGALALTACSEEEAEILPTYNAGATFNPAPGTTTTGGGGDTTPPVLLSARTIGTTQVELTYNEPMQVGDPAATAAMFTLNRNVVNYGVNWGEINSPAVSSLYPYVPISITSYYSFASPGIAGSGITAVSVSSADNTRVILNLVTGLLEGDDDATGKLRLNFTNGANGVADQAGNTAPDIAAPPSNDRGNVDDGSNAPGLIDARTINANTVELTFSEPVKTANPIAAAGDFKITENFRFNLYANFSGGASVYWGYFPYNSLSPPYNVYNMAASGLYITPQQLKIVLTTLRPIGGGADWGNGRIRLYYAPGASPITDLGNTPLQPINPTGQHRGNVIDTIP